jgi:hypothetical protein
MPAFILLVVIGSFPDAKFVLTPFSDRTGCSEAQRLVLDIVPQNPVSASCYDTYLQMVVSSARRGKVE